MTVLYISNRTIRVVEGEGSEGRIRIKNLISKTDEKGCILNGVLTDPEGFQELIGELWNENHLPKKNVHLVIDSNQFNTRVIEMPKLNNVKKLEYIRREFSDVERMEDPVYGFFKMESLRNNFERVFATVVSREFLENYISIFDALGITVQSVESAMGTVVQLFKNLKQVEKKTCIIQFVDDMTLINVLLDSGKYFYATRARLFSEPGTTAYAAEAAHAVNNILQFAQAQKLPNPVTDVLIAGLAPEVLEDYHNSIQRIDMTLNTDWLQGGKEFKFPKEVENDPATCTQFTLAMSGLLGVDLKTNILTQSKVDPELAARRAKRKKTLLPIIILAAIFLVIVGIEGASVMYLDNQVDEVQQYTKNENMIAGCAEYDNLKNEVNAYSNLNDNIAGVKDTVEGYPIVDSEIQQRLFQCAEGLVEVKITGYSSSNGMLSFSASASNTENINQFIKTLNQQDMFATTDYTGYSQDSEGSWNINVFCTMAGRQEEEDATDNN